MSKRNTPPAVPGEHSVKPDVIDMAIQVGAKFDPNWGLAYNVGTATFRRFANLVCAAERDRIINGLQDLWDEREAAHGNRAGEYHNGFLSGLDAAKALIRGHNS